MDSVVSNDNPQISTIDDMKLFYSSLDSDISVAYNNLYTSFVTNSGRTIVFPNSIGKDIVIDIFKNPNIMKIVSKPLSSLKTFLKNNTCLNCVHISTYISDNGNQRNIPAMKQEIINQDSESDLKTRAVGVASIIMKYKIQADKEGKPVKTHRKIFFNKKRDCYLLYLSIYNDILSRFGPMRFIELIRRAHNYPNLCRTNLHPALALEGLIKSGALISDSRTTFVTIPDQKY